MIENCLICGLDFLKRNNECSFLQCKTEDHMFNITHDNDGNHPCIISLGYSIFNSQNYYYVFFDYFNKKSGVSFFKFKTEDHSLYGYIGEIVFPWFEPDLNDFQKIIDKVKLYVTFS